MEQRGTGTTMNKGMLNQGMPISRKDRSITFVKRITIIFIVVLLIAMGTAGYFYKQLLDLKNNPNKLAQDELNSILIAVGKLMVLPADEQPTIATVTNPEKLKNQPFFTRAEKGDKVLIYTNAKRAILYRPELDKIIEVAPLSIGGPSL